MNYFISYILNFEYLGITNKLREEPDPHVIVNTVNSILKDMYESVFNDVYDDIVACEITEDSISCKSQILSWLLKLDLQHFEFVILLHYLFYIKHITLFNFMYYILN